MAYSAISCSSLLSEDDFYDNMDSTRTSYFQENTRSNLTAHLYATSQLLSSDGVQHVLHENSIKILPITGSPLNNFARKAYQLSGVTTFYDPKTLHEDSAQAMAIVDIAADRSQTPSKLLVSYELVATNRISSADAHEWTHLLQTRYLSKSSKQGNIFNAIFRSENTVVPFDEVRTYFTTLSTLIRELKDEVYPYEVFKDEFDIHLEQLSFYLGLYQDFLRNFKSIPFSEKTRSWIQHSETHFESEDGYFDVLLSPVDKNYLVTVLITTEEGEISIPLPTHITLDLETEGYTPFNNNIISQVELQVKYMVSVTEKVGQLTLPSSEDIDLYNDFIRSYRAILKPHL